MPSTDSANAQPSLRSLPEIVLWSGVLRSLSGCTSALSMFPQDLHLADGAVPGFISQHFQSLTENGLSLERVPVCLISLQPLSLPHSSLHSPLYPSPATLQPKLKPLSQGFNSDYPRHAGKWTLMSGGQNRAYNKGGPSCGQQQWGEGGAHRVTSQKDCILRAAASSNSRAWRHQTCQLKRPMNI